ncbi:enoyl-CoA hydratase domain-containing protein 3, mitochondrial-like [Mizuhopecten yessoensis]|uniref:enoyl-CoA hydratase domain-containing protein 3, mitochondrial-like n=1 Tax=Mizuhopecten yessoensis TaxID=6573 RepID=UPI000B45D8DD|nr:enoyl-CoA hydratase domain-containing protein 3, mitochondrial-like [Mizuhopecten yessoensis]
MMAGRLWRSRLLQIANITRQFSTQRSRLQRPDKGYTITTEEKGIRTICLNDPKKRNALSLGMLEALRSDLSHQTDDLRVIILTAKGPVFSAGHDLKELTTKEGRNHHMQVFQTCTEVMVMVQELPVPVIAQVSGLATAAGCQLVASCDMAVATDTSRFATPGVSVGLFCSTPAVAVGRSVPRKVAMEMLFTGHPISAQDALLHGLVSRVVPEDELEETTLGIANRICETSKSVVALGKATFYAQMNLERKEAYTLTSKVMVENLSLGDGQEGIRAFIEKRKPSWSHDTKKVH